MRLDTFAETIGHTIDLTRLPGQKGRWMCTLEHAQVMEHGLLGFLHGNGKTPEEAMIDYARCIAGKRIVINSDTPYRKEYIVPDDLVGPDAVAADATRVRLAIETDREGFACVYWIGNREEVTPSAPGRRVCTVVVDVPLPEPVVELGATIENA